MMMLITWEGIYEDHVPNGKYVIDCLEKLSKSVKGSKPRLHDDCMTAMGYLWYWWGFPILLVSMNLETKLSCISESAMWNTPCLDIR